MAQHQAVNLSAEAGDRQNLCESWCGAEPQVSDGLKMEAAFKKHFHYAGQAAILNAILNAIIEHSAAYFWVKMCVFVVEVKPIKVNEYKKG